MPAFLVSLDRASGKTFHNGVNAMLVIAEDDDAALAAAQAKYPGLSIWSDAQVTDLKVLEEGDDQAVPPVAPFDGVYAQFTRMV